MTKKKKRGYTHRKGKIMPVGHGSIMDEIDHTLSPTGGSYKTKKKKKYIWDL